MIQKRTMAKELDQTDYAILTLLSKDAQLPYSEVAKRLSISGGTVNLRLKKMKEMGIVKGTTLSMDYAKLGWKLTVFVFVQLDKSADFKRVINALREVPEVVKIHHITGKYGLFFKVHAKDPQHYRKVYEEDIMPIEGISMTETFVSINEDLNRHIKFGM